MSSDPEPVVTAPPVTSPRAIDYEDGFAYLFRRPGGPAVLAIGGVLLLFFWLVVPLLVVIGYGAALGRAVAAGRPELPRFELGMAADGLRAVVVMFGYALPMLILYAAGTVPLFLAEAMESGALSGIFVAGTVLAFLVVFVYGLALAALQPAIFAVFIADGSIGACFRVARVRSVIRYWRGSYWAVAAIIFGVSQLVGAGFVLFLIGIAFTSFYFITMAAHFCGQLARPLLQPAGGPPPASPAPPASTLAPSTEANPAPGSTGEVVANQPEAEEIAPPPSDTTVLEVPPAPPAGREGASPG